MLPRHLVSTYIDHGLIILFLYITVSYIENALNCCILLCVLNKEMHLFLRESQEPSIDYEQSTNILSHFHTGLGIKQDNDRTQVSDYEPSPRGSSSFVITSFFFSFFFFTRKPGTFY